MPIKGIRRGKKRFKNDPNLSILRQKVPLRSKCARNDHWGWWGSSQALPECNGNLSYLWLLVKIWHFSALIKEQMFSIETMVKTATWCKISVHLFPFRMSSVKHNPKQTNLVKFWLKTFLFSHNFYISFICLGGVGLIFIICFKC
jgi:hypothetical protein